MICECEMEYYGKLGGMKVDDLQVNLNPFLVLNTCKDISNFKS